MKRSRLLATAGAVAVLAALAVAAATSAGSTAGDTALGAEPALAAPGPAPEAGTTVVAAGGVIERKPAAAPPRRSRELELPDGTSVPALNDAVDAAPLAVYWGPSPWSPITGVERSSAGVDWYRHADGSYSTTQMVWRKDLGRHAAMTRVAHPGPTAPIASTPRAR